VINSAKVKIFEALPGRYYIADAGYSNTPMTLTPYRGVRYHLREQMQANIRPQNAKELFNLRHAALRDVVERTIGVFKHRFRYSEAGRRNLPLRTQVEVTYASTAVHNSINV
jgi:DDE superfamily endonuclease